jgi:hypothetical protein
MSWTAARDPTYLRGHLGSDVLSSGGDDDLIVATERDLGPARRDIVDCGDGVDHVEADRKDIVASTCETVTRN